ncbi:kinase-like domain-containing protein [Morchella snyderi]|nr:kinase-like domain-containing protein [Morchella snyderi]
MSQLLYRLITSDHFSDNPFLAVAYLARYSGHIGIHHFLCTKLREFSYEEIEFFLPQLCHLLVSIENTESVALEEFIFELCEKSAHGALLTFWLFQTHLHDLSGDPTSSAFKTCRRIYNKVQHIVFGAEESKKKERLKENVLPVTLLASLVIGSVAAPFLPKFAGPLAVAQARKPHVYQSITDLPGKLTRSKTIATGQSSRPKKERPRVKTSDSTATVSTNQPSHTKSPRSPHSTPTSPAIRPERRSFSLTRRSSFKSDSLNVPLMSPTASSSLPDLRMQRSVTLGSSSGTNNIRRRKERPLAAAQLSTAKKIHMLRANYFRNQTQFLSALEDISNKMVLVPKPIRLSALRTELALLNNYLPAEVDIPVICPATAGQDSWQPGHHRVVRINPAEATVLNSAERVPYLLMVEVLRDDFDFDPEKPDNQRLLSTLLSEEGAEGSRRRMFDLSEVPPAAYRNDNGETEVDSVFEPSTGDIGTTPVANGNLVEDVDQNSDPEVPAAKAAVPIPRLSSGASSRTSERSATRSGSPGPRKPYGSSRPISEAPDLSALATHMRMASAMLAQLDASSSKRPKNEVAAIKEKIIAKEWTVKRERIRKSSPYGWCKNWDLLSVIVKTGADLRQEAFACQLIHVCDKIWKKAGIPVWVKRMQILVTGESAGLIETITNGTSLHSLKRSLTIASIASGKNPKGRIASLKEHFVKTFGEPDSETYKAAVDAFTRSLAAYSVICYILQLKDRHNGNVLIDNQGHIIHIDFGFMLSNSPGSVGFESAPFKLTQEYVDVLGGALSPEFEKFRVLFKQAFQALRKSADNLVDLVELMGKESRMPCFSSGVVYATTQLRQRFQLHLSEAEAGTFVDDVLIRGSLGSYSTRMYDQFQYLSQGIY